MTEDFTNEVLQSAPPDATSPTPASSPIALPEAAAHTTDSAPNPASGPAPDPVSDPASSLQPAMDAASPSASPVGEAPMPLHIAVSALSDMGCVRTNNEDSFGYDEELGIFVVCDGMGGMASGEVASSLAVAAIVNTFAGSACSDYPVSARLLQAVQAANHDVWENGQTEENKGMGTTLVAAALEGDKLILGNVGDSRAYLLQADRCAQLTVDHSYVNELIRNGTLTIENAHNADLGGMESVITRAIGAAPEVEPDFYWVDLKPGTAVLLATDGLTRYLLQDEIATILHASPFDSACANLIDLAKQRGGHDNITCLLLNVTSGTEKAEYHASTLEMDLIQNSAPTRKFLTTD